MRRPVRKRVAIFSISSRYHSHFPQYLEVKIDAKLFTFAAKLPLSLFRTGAGCWSHHSVHPTMHCSAQIRFAAVGVCRWWVAVFKIAFLYYWTQIKITWSGYSCHIYQQYLFFFAALRITFAGYRFIHCYNDKIFLIKIGQLKCVHEPLYSRYAAANALTSSAMVTATTVTAVTGAFYRT